jgi:hypothetical protein
MTMKRLNRGKAFSVALLLSALPGLGFAQEPPANSLQTVHDKLRGDKRTIVAQYMNLSDAEAKKFWPVYDEYQAALQQVDQRLLNLLQTYAADYRNNSLTDDKAKVLLADWIAIDTDDAKRRATFAPKVLKVLPPKKAARYLQIENEYRIMMRYDLATTVPLVE